MRRTRLLESRATFRPSQSPVAEGGKSGSLANVKQKNQPVDAADLVGDEWAAWYRLTPLQRWEESAGLWQTYLTLGGSLDPEPDTQSPFFDGVTRGALSADGRAGVRVLRRCRIQ